MRIIFLMDLMGIEFLIYRGWKLPAVEIFSYNLSKMKKSNTGTYHPTGARRYSHSNFKNGGTIRACCFRAVGERWGQQYGTRVATAWMIWWCRAARDDLITCFCSIAPVGVQLQKPRPTRTWGMYYAERDSAFAQRLGTVGQQSNKHCRKV